MFLRIAVTVRHLIAEHHLVTSQTTARQQLVKFPTTKRTKHIGVQIQHSIRLIFGKQAERQKRFSHSLPMNRTRSLVSKVHAHNKSVISQTHVFMHRLVVNIEGRLEHRLNSVRHKLRLHIILSQLFLTPTTHSNRCHIRSLAPLQDQRWNRVVVNRCP